MQDDITAFVGLDVHKDSIAIAVAEAGRTAPSSWALMCLKGIEFVAASLIVSELGLAGTTSPVLAIPAARRPRHALEQDLRGHRA